MTEVKFFVYGSMTEGMVHFNRIKDFIQRIEKGSIRGSAYRLRVGFPVILEQGSDQIPGQIVTVNASDLLFSLLDQFHGYNVQDENKSLYFKRQVEVTNENGVVETCMVYFLNPAKLPATATKIENGDWMSVCCSGTFLTEKLTEKQRAYVLRLGASSGREIIPIDLSLYRELMNLEMIVDKGRRLALSKLGNEVFRYLA